MGKTYEYEYDMKTMTSLMNKEEKAAEIKLAAKVFLTPASKCQLSMQLRDVRIEDGSAFDHFEFAGKLEKLPLSFAYHDGVVEEVCVAPAEDSKVLNIKRGIISTLQNSMKDLEKEVTVSETDVLGVCDTHYTVASGWGAKTITKTKDLLSCTKRDSQFSSLSSMTYAADSSIQHLPLVKSDFKCVQEVSDKIIKSALVEETHVLRPFIDQSSAPFTKTTQAMKFKKATAALRFEEAPSVIKSSLLFDHHAVTDVKVTQVSLAMDILSELVMERADEVSPRVTQKFSHLINVIKGLRYDELKAVSQKIAALHREKQFFFDALPMAASGGAIRLMHDIFASASDMLSVAKQDMWLTSLGFTANPNLDMVDAAAKFLAGVPRKQALLGVSAMVHRYCSANAACIEEAPVREVVAKLESFLGASCRPAYPLDEHLMVVALKALGNIGRVVNGAASLEKCIKDADNSMVIRLAAVDAFRRMPCEKVSREMLMEAFKDAELDAEIRIGAYLGVMKCPSAYAVMGVKSALESMPVNQVSSFVWTHLTNLQESADPLKQDIRQHVRKDFLKQKFDTEARKFSRNIEGSMFFDAINAGATWDSNIVFSPKSYLPRSANLDLTVNLFGQAYNLFEIGGRAEGFEKYIEGIFGADGLYPEEHIQSVLKGLTEKPEKKASFMNQLGWGSAAEKAPEAAVFVKMFGNDIIFEDIKSMGSVFDLLGKFKPKDILDFKPQDIDYTKSIKFLDVEFAVPLISGMALNIGANGKTMLRFQAGGKFNMENFFINGDLEIDGHIKPSAVVEVNSLFSTIMGDNKLGMESVSTLHTSSFVDGSVIKKGGKLVQAKLNTPRDKVEVFDVKSKVFKFMNKEKVPMFPDAEANAIKMCTPELSHQLLAYKGCAKVGYNSPLDLSAEVFLKKTDKIEFYVFSWEYKKVKALHSLEITMDTPKSNIDRRIALNYALDTELSALNVELYTPVFNFDINGKFKLGPELSFADLAISYNKELILNLDAAFSKVVKGAVTHIEPKFALTAKGFKLIALKGFMDINPVGKNAVDLAIATAFAKTPITLAGTFKFAGALTTMNLAFATPVFATTVEVAGNLDAKKVKLVTKYTLWHHAEHTIEFVGQAAFKKIGKLTKIDGLFDLKHSAFVAWPVHVEIASQLAAGHVENAMKIKVGVHEIAVDQLL